MLQNYREKGSMAVYVTVALLSMLILLSGIYLTATSVRRNQIITAMKIKETYEKDNSKAGQIYYEQISKIGPEQKLFTFSYTGAEQVFTAPATGKYKIECWGASGGNSFITGITEYGGKGGYTSGEISLTEGEQLYIYVGGAGSTVDADSTSDTGGYNGGQTIDNRTKCIWRTWWRSN